jgi:hypothetical protein
MASPFVGFACNHNSNSLAKLNRESNSPDAFRNADEGNSQKVGTIMISVTGRSTTGITM